MTLHPLDRGTQPDPGTQPDRGTRSHRGLQPDPGTQPDRGTRPDRGMQADGGTQSGGSGMRSDRGMQSDRRSQPDREMRSDRGALSGGGTLPIGETRAGRRRPKCWSVAVHHGGRSYVATAEMAEIFARRAEAAIRNGRSELVPLAHRGGVELLLVGPATRYTIVQVAPTQSESPGEASGG